MKALLGKMKDAQKMMSDVWAIEPSHFEKIKSLYSNFEKDPRSFLGLVDQDPEKNSLAFDMDPETDASRTLTFKGNTAFIAVKGPIVNEHNCMTLFFGCCSFADIGAAILEAENEEGIEKIIFDIDSPGGMVSGCDNIAIKIKNSNLETIARVQDLAASAAFWIASQCNSIEATSLTAQFGSIGVIIDFVDDTRKMENEGFDKILIKSTGAPNKRVDIRTEEGKQKIIADLDEVEEIFVRRVAEGRGVSTSVVQEKFGKGGMFLAEKSLSRGMIDKLNILGEDSVLPESSDHGPEQEETSIPEESVKLSEVLEKNPEIQTEIDAQTKKSVDEALEKQSSENTKRIDTAAKFLNSSYPNAVQELAIKTIKGDATVDALEVTVSTIDALKEKKNSDDAVVETTDLGETQPEKTNEESVEGNILDDESHVDTITRLKKIK